MRHGMLNVLPTFSCTKPRCPSLWIYESISKSMLRATEFAHLLMRQSIKPGDWVVDATVGNGHDTLLLAKLVGPTGRVIGFDVQEAALAAATARVDGMAAGYTYSRRT